MKKKIIISGGGIGGLTAAILFQKNGHDVTLIDKAHEFSNAGFLLSLKSFGYKFMKELGLGQKLIDASITSDTMSFANANGDTLCELHYAADTKISSNTVTMSRGALHTVIYNEVKDKVKVLFNTTVSEATNSTNSVSVKLSNGEVLEADLLIISEGLRSSSRSFLFPKANVEDFNVFYVGGRLLGTHPYRVGAFKTYIDINKMLSIYPISKNELAIQCYINNTDDAEEIRQEGSDKLLKETFRKDNKEIRDLIERLSHAGQVFSDKMCMVHAPNYENGRIVLLGDAAYCPTALSGMGASLSIFGAKALSHFIDQNPDDIKLALQNYNLVMQPVADKFQTNARGNAATFIPKTKWRLLIFKSFFKFASKKAMLKRMTEQLILSEEQLRFELPATESV